MRKYRRQVLVLLGILLVALVVSRLLAGNTFRASVPWNGSPADPLPAVQVEETENARIENLSLENGILTFDVVPLKHGSATVTVPGPDGEAADTLFLSVSRTGTVSSLETGDFPGDLAMMALITLFLFIISAMMLHGFLTAKGPELYSYSTMFYIGFFFFALIAGIAIAAVTLTHMIHPESYAMLNVYESLSSVPVFFLRWTFLLLLAFSLALAASNIALLRHNRPRVQNVLGLLISMLIIGGASFCFWLAYRDFSGSLQEYRIDTTICNVACMAFVYFECILAGAVICGIRAAWHRVSPGRDVIIILGCWFRPDGTLPPLLRGRADRAVEYWQDTLEKTGREAYMIPSGGQGPDEPMPEAEALRAYLISRGIPENRIIPETKSASTYQNLLFSRRIMAENGLPLRCVYATTNYHVFRSGMWAARAGLDAEGISSRTRWWFWPNAFMRECIGLIASRWKQELVLLLGFTAFFAFLSVTLIT